MEQLPYLELDRISILVWRRVDELRHLNDEDRWPILTCHVQAFIKGMEDAGYTITPPNTACSRPRSCAGQRFR